MCNVSAECSNGEFFAVLAEGGHLMMRPLSKRERLRGDKRVKKLQSRIMRAEAEGEGRKARSLRRLLARSYAVALGLMTAEMEHQNSRRRRPVEGGVSAQIDCNALQRSLTAGIWFDEELRSSEVLIPKVVDGELVAGDIVQVRPQSAPQYCRRWKNQDARKKAAALRLGHSSGDRYSVHSVKKRSGGFRPIHSFGVADRVKQRQLLLAYGDRLPISGNLYNVPKKGGRPAAIEEIMRLINSGARWAVVLDIKNFFGAVSRSWLMRTLPLPRAFIRSTIIQEDTSEPEGRYMRDAMGIAQTRARLIIKDDQIDAQDITGLYFKSQAGLPQGAATSSVIASYILSEALKIVELPNGVFLIIYADDMLLLGANKVDVEMAIRTLSRSFVTYPGGPFELHEQKIRRVSDGFEFLGMCIKSRKGRAECHPSASALRRARLRILDAASEALKSGKMEGLARTVNGVAASFSPWRARSNWVWYLLQQLKQCFPELTGSGLEKLNNRLRRDAQAGLSAIVEVKF